MIKRIKLELEGIKFGYQYGKKCKLANPFLATSAIAKRAQLAWFKHLMNTNRAYLVHRQARELVNKYTDIL